MVLPVFKFPAPKTEGGWFRAYDHGWSGSDGIVEGLREVLDAKGEKVVTWIVADHHSKGGKVYKGVTIGYGEISGRAAFRFCVGGDDDPDGPGSHTLSDADDLALAATKLALELSSAYGDGRHIYRQPAVRRIGWDLDGSIQ